MTERLHFHLPARVWVMPALALFLSSCASMDVNRSMERINSRHVEFTQDLLQLAQTPGQRKAMREKADALLQQPVNQTTAVNLLLVNSPAFQALLARHWADGAQAAQTGRPGNPVFTFERTTLLDELEIGRLLTFGLIDLLSLPARQGVAATAIERSELAMANSVVEQVTQVRQTWVNAVAARQQAAYARQVADSAKASAELAKRMQEVGNFNRLTRARQQAYYADAVSSLALAEQKATAAREQLVRLLGLTDQQAQQLSLPDRLPDIPTQPLMPAAMNVQQDNRLDVQMARLRLKELNQAQTVSLIGSFLDVDAGIRRDSVFDNAAGTSATRKGYELDLRLPLLDWGDQKRAAYSATTLATLNTLDATLRASNSSLREQYANYRTAWDIAHHYQTEVVPLKKIISDENLLRYNGMLIGVFELLADSREQINAVMGALQAQADFWRADAALKAALVGKPMDTALSSPLRASASAEPAGH
ncbi:TolC family protein [Limnobacter humi]|uniref:TolC family protein n=1 Tax=Limnobacter humi TaxID=1778671 RepID=A0ABT1WDD5_9BURK|nr:TolC family protein [Limnobacter humi]MCQ8895505.1 TolC family protein [Limnobacter humi]